MIHSEIAKVIKRKYIGKCIYCSSVKNLQDEHCIPESLNGVYLLEKASCDKCGKITGKFEGRYTGNTLLPVRTAWNMKSKRSKSKRPKEFPMKFAKEGEEKLINVPVEDHFSVIPLFEIGAPGKYSHKPHAKGLKHGQIQLNPFKIRSDEHIEYLKVKYDADEVSVDFDLYVEDFFRMIAKIAYCFTIWRYGLNNIGKVYVLPAILGESNDLWQWVGSDGLQEIHKLTKQMNTDHIVSTWFTPSGELQARVKLFKKSETPEYDVIVGQLTQLAHDFYRSMGFK